MEYYMSFTESTTIPFTKEFKGVTPTSKPRWYYTFNCPDCGNQVTKVKYKNFTWKCRSCSHTTTDTEDFIKRSKEKFGDIYDYSKTKCINVRTKVTITCPLHGDFQVRIKDHLNPKTLNGCPTCGNLRQQKAITRPIEEWKILLTDKFNDKFTIKSYEKVGFKNPVQIECKEHGEFTTTFGAINQAKYLCPECARCSHQKQSQVGTEPFARLYYTYIPEIDMYKFGLSTYRSSSLSGTKHDKLWEKWYSYKDAIDLEHEVHQELDDYRYKGKKKLIKAGNTELYKCNVEQQILAILDRASQKQFCVERILNGETPHEDNPVLN